MRRSVCAFLAAIGLTVGADLPAPTVDLQVRPAELVRTLPTSIYATLAGSEWSRPARGLVSRLVADLSKRAGSIDVMQTLTQADLAWLRLWPATPDGGPRWSLRLTLTPDWADRLMKLAASQGAALPGDPRWQAAIGLTVDPQLRVIRLGEPGVVVLNRAALEALLERPQATAAHLRATVDPALLFPSAGDAGLPPFQVAATASATGIDERLVWPVQATWLTTPDRSVIARLPASTAMAIAAGVDGQALDSAKAMQVLSWFGRVSRLAALTPDDLKAKLDVPLQRAATSAAEVIRSLRGTIVLGVTNAAPLPGILIAVPRSPAVDAAVNLVIQDLCLAHYRAPAENTILAFPHAALGTVAVLPTATHWILSTDIEAVASWQRGGGLPVARSAALAAIPPSATVIGLSDTAAILRQGAVRLGLTTPDGDPSYPLVNTLVQWSLRTDAGWWFLEPTTDGIQHRSHGVSGVLPLLAAMMSHQVRTVQEAAATKR
jgi:hypothetical protein